MGETHQRNTSEEPALLRAWYEGRWWLWGLLPLAWLFQLISLLRRNFYRGGKPSTGVGVPVVVIGNIALGGTGKTPLIVTLVEALRQQGFKPGVVSRGYGSRAPHYPFVVSANGNAEEAGDEPLLIAKRTQCPVVIDPKRRVAVEALCQQFDCDVILSDDGLQHYALPRDLEIVVIDGKRGLGNGLCLPAGPLRESPARLNSVDWVVVNGANGQSYGPNAVTMNLQVQDWRRVVDDEVATLSSNDAHALTGIGNPNRFFSSLEQLGIQYQSRIFPDHHHYQLSDIEFADQKPVVMTEKDAVKVRALLTNNTMDKDAAARYFYLPITAQVPQPFVTALIDKVRSLQHRG